MSTKDDKGRRLLTIDSEQFNTMANSDWNLTLATVALLIAQCKTLDVEPKTIIGDAKHLLDKIKHFR